MPAASLARPDGFDGSIDVPLNREVGQESVEALGALYDLHAGRLLAVAQRVLGNRESAEDVVAESFLAVWRTALSGEAPLPKPESTLMTEILHRCAARMAR